MKLEDIARLAGVSKGTVSLALNGKKGVSEQKRQEILQIAKDNQYIPLRQSKKETVSLETASNYLIRFVTSSNPPLLPGQVQSLPYFNELLSDLSTLSQDLPTSLLINTFSFESILEDLSKAEHFQKSDGIILLGTGLPNETIQEITSAHHNVVVVDTTIPQFNANFVSMNNFQGAYLATEYLIKKGHHSIGYAFGDVRLQNFKERMRGYRAALDDYKLSPENDVSLKFPFSSISIQDLDIPLLPSAFFCDNDSVAISLIKSLQNKGLSVPDDVSVIGFDNIAESRVTTPELTTVNVSRKDLVKQALRKIMRIISDQNRESSSQTLINATIVERKSVKEFSQDN